MWTYRLVKISWAIYNNGLLNQNAHREIMTGDYSVRGGGTSSRKSLIFSSREHHLCAIVHCTSAAADMWTWTILYCCRVHEVPGYSIKHCSARTRPSTASKTVTWCALTRSASIGEQAQSCAKERWPWKFDCFASQIDQQIERSRDSLLCDTKSLRTQLIFYPLPLPYTRTTQSVRISQNRKVRFYPPPHTHTLLGCGSVE